MNQIVDTFMKQSPPEAEILQMPPDDLGMHLLKSMMRSNSATNRFNFCQMIPGGQIAMRFMEAWSWLAREGFIAFAPNDMNGQSFFVTRVGAAVAQLDDLEARSS